MSDVMKHQQRTERAAQAASHRAVTLQSSTDRALWQIAHSLAAIADALASAALVEGTQGGTE